MKILRLISYLFVICLSAVTAFSLPAAAAQTYKIDPVHSSVVFRIKHLDITYVYGRFNSPSGMLQFDSNDDAGNSIEMTVETIHIDTNNAKRDAHLKSEDFFNNIKYPYISFKSKSFTKIEPDLYEVSGDLTLHGVTKPLTVTARHTGSGQDPWGGNRIGFETTFPIQRSDFGMSGMLNSVGDAVQITVSVEGIRQ